MVRFPPPISLFWHWKCALSLETTLSYLAKSKVDNPPSVLCLKSPQSKKCQSLWTPELENPTQLYPLEIPPHAVTVWLPWWCQQQHQWQRYELQLYHTRKLIWVGCGLPARCCSGIFCTLLNPYHNPMRWRSYHASLDKGVPWSPSPHPQSYLPPLLDAHIMKWLFM